MKLKKALASVLVIALLATLSLTVFAAPVATTEPAVIYVVSGRTQVGDETPVVLAATSTNATNGETTFTKSKTPAGFFFDGWTIAGSGQLIGTDASLADNKIIVVGNEPDVTVTEHYTAIVEVGTQKVAVFSWATGIMLPCGTAEYTLFNSGSPKIKSPALLGKNLTVNADGTVTFTRTEKSGNKFVGGENKFVGWALDGEFEVISGSATSDELTVRIIKGRDIAGVVKDDEGNYIYKDDQDNAIIVDNIFGAYEMYDVSETVKGVVKVSYDALMVLHDHLVEFHKAHGGDLLPTKDKPADTDKAADDKTDIPETGSGSLTALAVVMVLSSTVAIVTKKRYRA